MHEQDTVVLHFPRRGRHRLPASSLRRAVSRMSLGAAAVVLTIGLAVVAAVATGLTGGQLGDFAGLPAPEPSHQSGAGPAPALNGGIGSGATVEPTPASAADVPDLAVSAVDEAPDPAPVGHASPAPAGDPAPVDGAESPPVATVSPGDPCQAEGAAGITAGGKPTVCTRRGDGRARWRTS
jgi:hypothetical protein